MKNGRIWLVILLILVTGGLSTNFTKTYISQQELTPAKSSVSIAPSSERESDPIKLAASPISDVDQQESVGRLGTEEVILPEIFYAAEPKSIGTSEHLTRLEELDIQIAKNRTLEGDGTASYSMKAKAEQACKLWETELENVVNVLKERLSSEEEERLITEQRDWYREREAKAMEASKKQSGSSLEEIEYTISIGESTRSRAYQLVTEYEAVLMD